MRRDEGFLPLVSNERSCWPLPSAREGIAEHCGLILHNRSIGGCAGRICRCNHGLVPILAQSSTRFVEELAFLISGGFGLLFAIPDGCGLTVADGVQFVAEADRACWEHRL